MSDEEVITWVHHEEWARVVAALTRRFGDLDIAKEAAAEAFEPPSSGGRPTAIAPNPGAWLTTTATRRIRRENTRDDRDREAQMAYHGDPPELVGAIDDGRLRLTFTCCRTGSKGVQ